MKDSSEPIDRQVSMNYQSNVSLVSDHNEASKTVKIE
jgi:hypothetical protein